MNPMTDRVALDDAYRVLRTHLCRELLHQLSTDVAVDISEAASMLSGTSPDSATQRELELTLHHSEVPLMISLGVLERSATDRIKLTPFGRDLTRADIAARKELGDVIYEVQSTDQPFLSSSSQGKNSPWAVESAETHDPYCEDCERVGDR